MKLYYGNEINFVIDEFGLTSKLLNDWNDLISLLEPLLFDLCSEVDNFEETSFERIMRDNCKEESPSNYCIGLKKHYKIKDELWFSLCSYFVKTKNPRFRLDFEIEDIIEDTTTNTLVFVLTRISPGG